MLRAEAEVNPLEHKVSERTPDDKQQLSYSSEVHLGEGGAKGMVVVSTRPVNTVPRPNNKLPETSSAPKK